MDVPARNPLEQRFRALARRALTLASLTGVGWGLLAAAAVWLGFAWLDLLWELSPQVRIAANYFSAAAALLALAAAVRWARRTSRPRFLARRLDEAAASGGQIESGYDLARGSGVPPLRSAPRTTAATSGVAVSHFGDAAAIGLAAPPLTRGLAQLAVARAVRLAAAVHGSRVVSSRPLRFTVGIVAGVGVAVAGLALLMPRLAETQWLRFHDPFGDHPPYSRVQFAVLPGNAQVLYGHPQEVTVVTEGPPVERVDLVLRGSGSAADETLPLFPESDGHWRGLLTNVTAPVDYYARAGRSRSHHFALDVLTIPRLESVRFRVTPPAYTRRPAYEGPLPQGGLAGLPGTQVQIWAKSNRPLRGGGLKIAADATAADSTATAASSSVPSVARIDLKPSADEPEQVTGSFEIRAAGKIEVGVTDVDGRDSEQKFAAQITLLKDEQPFIRIVQPPKMSLATPQATLPVVLSGEDDYGISRVALFRSLNDSRALPLEFTVAKPPAARFDTTEALPLSAYGLEPGDVIKVFARIEDNDPAGAKGMESPMVEVRIISQAEYEQMVRAREGLEVLMSKYRAAQRRLEALAESQEGLRKKLKDAHDGKLPDSARSDLQKLTAQLRHDAEELRHSAEHLLPYDVDHQLSKQLEQLAAALDAQAQKLADLEAQDNLSAEELSKLLDELAKQLGADRGDLHAKALEPLEHLEQLYPLIEDQARFVALYEQQRDLAERLASLKGHDREDNPLDKARMRDLEAQQRRIQEALGQLLDDIDDHIKQLPEDSALDTLRESARDFVEAARNGGVLEAMNDAETGLAEFSGTRGHAGALKAADLMERLLNKGEKMQTDGQGALAFSPGLAAMLGDTVAQLLGERGLGLGKGPPGGGGGQSASRNSLDNVGLFGQLPGQDQHPEGGNRGRGRGNQTTAGLNSNPDSQTGAVDAQGQLRASGAGGVPVPLRYKSRVSAYLQRIIEEQNDASH